MRNRAWLFTGNCPSSIVSGYERLGRDDVLIAVDGGLTKMEALGLMPNLIIGDLDSVDADTVQLRYSGVEILRYPSVKNETDTELALLWCLKRGIEEIVICNDLQGRFDHALALVQNLLLVKERGVACRVESERQVVMLLKDETIFHYPPGTLLSLISLSNEAVFGMTTGLEYNLADITLYRHLSRGISNRINCLPATIRLQSGEVVAVLTIE